MEYIMETIARKPKEPQYEERRMSVAEYARFKKVTERTVYNWKDAGLIEYEQLSTHYPIEIIVKVRVVN